MKHVYLIISSVDYEGGVIESCWSTRARAELELKKISRACGDWFTIAKIQVDRACWINIPTNEGEEYIEA